MPTYQYACTECGDRLELVQRFSDEPLTMCTACGGRLRKVYSPVGIVFKGSGFYRTDSRASSVNGSNGKDKAAASAESSSSSDSSSSGSESAGKSESGKSESGKSESGGGASKPLAGAGSKQGNSSQASPKVA